jgi:glycerol-3-phosphate acyltransferase PlsY
MISWLCPFFGFLLGSVPFGLLIAKAYGVDIRQHGSGNIGATNVLRVLGKTPGISCLLLDAFKGFLPVALAVNLLQITGRPIQVPLGLPDAWVMKMAAGDALQVQIVHILTALAAVLGHNYSPWVGFKGGKGIATSAGVLIGLMPFAVLILLAVWLVLFLVTRYVSVASVGAAATLPLLTLWGSWHHGRIQDGTWNKPLFIFSLIIAVLAAWKHRSNFRRLREGTENRFERKSKPAAPSDSP